MKIKTIPQAAGIIYAMIVVGLIILGKWKEGAYYVVIWPVYLMLIYGYVVFVFSLITVPLYWITLPFRKYFIKKGKLTEQNDAKIKPFFIIITALLALYVFSGFFFLSDDAIWNDFKKVTNREPYPSTSIIGKGSDFWLECTSAIIEMKPKYYMKLLNQIQNDYRFESDGLGGSDAFSEAMEGYNTDDIIHTFEYPHIDPGTNGSFYQIGFFANRKWVIYHYCLIR
jgi:hypothetical protein